MSMYAPSDVRAINVAGGCGEAHSAGDLQPGDRWQIDCPACEAVLSSNLKHLGFAHREEDVLLTPDERAMLESEEKQGHAVTSLLVKQLGESLAGMLKGGSAPATPQVVTPSPDQIVAALQELPAEQLAGLLTKAGLAPADDDPAPAKKTAAPAKRVASRPAPKAE